MKAYIDSDILIWHLRGERKAVHFFQRLSSSGAELWIGALQRAEVVFFMRPHEEQGTMSFLSRFRTQPVGSQIVDRGAAMFRKWHKSHGVDINDAILAATVGETGGQLFTLNVKHYPMPEINVVKGW